MSFLSFFVEGKFRNIPLDITEKAQAIAQKYTKSFAGISKQELTAFANNVKHHPSWVEYLDDPGLTHFALMTAVVIKDLATNKNKRIHVYVVYGTPKTITDFAEYNEVNKTIILYDFHCKKLSLIDLESVIVHELTHGIQQYKGDLDSEQDSEEDELGYHLSPEEFDAFLTEMSYRITAEFNSLVKKTQATNSKINRNNLEKFLLELKLFIQSPLENYIFYKELPLPKAFKFSKEFLENIVNFVTYWNKFKTKLTHLYSSLINSLDSNEKMLQ